MSDEFDGAVLDEVRIVRYLDETGEEIVGVSFDGEASLVTRLGMIEFARDAMLNEPDPSGES